MKPLRYRLQKAAVNVKITRVQAHAQFSPQQSPSTSLASYTGDVNMMNADCALVVIRLPAHSLGAYPCERFNFMNGGDARLLLYFEPNLNALHTLNFFLELSSLQLCVHLLRSGAFELGTLI